MSAEGAYVALPAEVLDGAVKFLRGVRGDLDGGEAEGYDQAVDLLAELADRARAKDRTPQNAEETS